MILLSGATLVLPDRRVAGGTLAIDPPLIVEILEGERPASPGDRRIDASGDVIVPGFIDVHVHGVEGVDTLDAGPALEAMACRLVRYGTTAFCPTTVACEPEALRRVLEAVAAMRAAPPRGAARVLPAHLESNFISPQYRGAQPLECLRVPPPPGRERSQTSRAGPARDYTGADILAVVAAARPAVAIVTMAPELPGGIDLVRALAASGHRVSLGHSGASFEEGLAAIEAGARHATHLFNRMPPLHHRSPGLAGAVLTRDEVDAEVICDGYHVHPAMVRAAIQAKTDARILAITDGTAGSGLSPGARASLGGRPITVRGEAAFLDDGTLAGSVLTMDGAFRVLVERVGVSLETAARLCATNPARALGLAGQGRLEAGALADFVRLDGSLHVRETWVAGEVVWARPDAR
jgi:N-acetylglucosamine-6-phosphate deacetylase